MYADLRGHQLRVHIAIEMLEVREHVARLAVQHLYDIGVLEIVGNLFFVEDGIDPEI